MKPRTCFCRWFRWAIFLCLWLPWKDKTLEKNDLEYTKISLPLWLLMQMSLLILFLRSVVFFGMHEMCSKINGILSVS